MNQINIKEYAYEILDETITDISSFIRKHCDLENKNLDCTYRTKYCHFEKGNVYVPKNENIALLRLQKFISLLKTLEDNEKITYIFKHNHGTIIPIFKRNGTGESNISPFNEMLKLIEPYHGKMFVFDYQELKEFIYIDFKSKEQTKISLEDYISDFKALVERQLYNDLYINGKPNESPGRANLQSFLIGRTYREVPVRGGKTDLLLFESEYRYLFETKIWRGPKYFRGGISGLEEYIQGENSDGKLKKAFYIIFDPGISEPSKKYLKNNKIKNIFGVDLEIVVIKISLPKPSKQFKK